MSGRTPEQRLAGAWQTYVEECQLARDTFVGEPAERETAFQTAGVAFLNTLKLIPGFTDVAAVEIGNTLLLTIDGLFKREGYAGGRILTKERLKQAVR